MATEIINPQTLIEAVRYFADPDVCHRYMVNVKWPTGTVCCPKCGSIDVGEIKSRRAFQCKAKECRKQFSTKVGTIFEDSPLGFDKWLPAVWAITNAKNGISSCELARALGVTQKSAWHMLHRIRLAMKTKSFQRITGEVESDETFVGGRLRNMHTAKRLKRLSIFGNRGGMAVIHGLLERGGEIRAQVIPRANRKTTMGFIRENVAEGSMLYTDIASWYRKVGPEYIHQAVNHACEYVNGRVHTNGLENFWSLFKRAAKGTYVCPSPEHLQRYLDEQVRRFNLRKMNDGERFQEVIRSVVGRRLTYKELTDGQAEAA